MQGHTLTECAHGRSVTPIEHCTNHIRSELSPDTGLARPLFHPFRVAQNEELAGQRARARRQHRQRLGIHVHSSAAAYSGARTQARKGSVAVASARTQARKGSVAVASSPALEHAAVAHPGAYMEHTRKDRASARKLNNRTHPHPHAPLLACARTTHTLSQHALLTCAQTPSHPYAARTTHSSNPVTSLRSTQHAQLTCAQTPPHSRAAPASPMLRTTRPRFDSEARGTGA